MKTGTAWPRNWKPLMPVINIHCVGPVRGCDYCPFGKKGGIGSEQLHRQGKIRIISSIKDADVIKTAPRSGRGQA